MPGVDAGAGARPATVRRLSQCGNFATMAGHSHDTPTMIETNPILAQIADLTGRVESLRGYL